MYAEITEEDVMEDECITKARLTLEWKEAADMYSRLATSIEDKKGNCSEEEYQRLQTVMETAQELSEQLLQDLKQQPLQNSSARRRSTTTITRRPTPNTTGGTGTRPT
jgi:hypothetical protein